MILKYTIPPEPALAVGLALSWPASGAAAGLDGAWCHPDWGAALFWEERSLGLGEHRICDWDEPPAGRTALTTTIHCRSIYLNGDEVVEMDHETHQFRATLRAENLLQVQFDADDPVDMTRCDD